jgi:hypothetical protein
MRWHLWTVTFATTVALLAGSCGSSKGTASPGATGGSSSTSTVAPSTTTAGTATPDSVVSALGAAGVTVCTDTSVSTQGTGLAYEQHAYYLGSKCASPETAVGEDLQINVYHSAADARQELSNNKGSTSPWWLGWILGTLGIEMPKSVPPDIGAQVQHVLENTLKAERVYDNVS